MTPKTKLHPLFIQNRSNWLNVPLWIERSGYKLKCLTEEDIYRINTQINIGLSLNLNDVMFNIEADKMKDASPEKDFSQNYFFKSTLDFIVTAYKQKMLSCYFFNLNASK